MQKFLYKKRILFFGMPDMGLVCLDKLLLEGVNIVGIVPPEKNDVSYNYFMNTICRCNIPVIDYERSLKDNDFISRIKSLNADLAVVCSYSKRFPPELLKCAKDGFLNIHPSLLPDYRGGNPYSRVIMNREKETGITVHFMDNSFDTGDIVYQIKFPLSGKETMGILFNMCNSISAELLVETLKTYEQKGVLPRFKQKADSDKKAFNIEANGVDNRIEWTKTAEETEAFIRALNPFILAVTMFRDTMVKVIQASYSPQNFTYGRVGEIVDINDSGIGIATGDGTIYLEVLQFGTYFITTAKNFVETFNVKKGELFV